MASAEHRHQRLRNDDCAGRLDGPGQDHMLRGGKFGAFRGDGRAASRSLPDHCPCTGAEAGCVSACVAAGICISLAAAMTGVNLAGRKTFRTPPRSARPRWSSSRETSSATAQTSPGNPLSPPQTNTTNNKQTQVEVARPRRRNRTSFDTRSRKKPALW